MVFYHYLDIYAHHYIKKGKKITGKSAIDLC